MSTDKDLLRQIVDKDDQAFAALYQRYWKLFYSWCHHRMRNKEEISDLLQNFWMWVWDYPEKVKTDHSGCAKNFLLHWISFRILDHFRAAKNNRVTADLTHLEYLSDPMTYSHILEELSYLDLKKILEQVLAELPEVAQKIYQLRYVEDRSVEETALLLHLSQGSIRNRASQTLAILRSEISQAYLKANSQ